MASRCASCSYPLSVVDSVSCCECRSYFHIDCAQLVGFPYYELSSDPIRNTFHCQTCKILPLPRQSDGFSDSDSEECAMPSRQLDYHLEGQSDFVKEMNEVRGSVQDLSELCKDMFREISELKSINLTLRCCVENLRHDSEQRDRMILDLKRRIEALEGKGIGNVFKPIESTQIFTDDGMNAEKEEDAERYSTPDPEYSRSKDVEYLENVSFEKEINLWSNGVHTSHKPCLDSGLSETLNISKRTKKQNSESSETVMENKQTETRDIIIEKDHEVNEEIHYAEEEIISTNYGEDNSETAGKDWDLRGDEAIQRKYNINNNEDEMEEEEEEEEKGVEEEGGVEKEEIKSTESEDPEAQGWEILDEDVKSEFVTKHYEDEASNTTMSAESSDPEGKRVTWADDVEDNAEDEENIDTDEDPDGSVPNEDNEELLFKSAMKYLSTSSQVVIESRSIFKEEETKETNEDVSEGADRTSLKEEEGVETPKFDKDIEIAEEGAEIEGRVDSADGSRLEGESLPGGDATAELGAAPEGVREGGQSPTVQGEFQPCEALEGSEPPQPPQPQHSPDDLWDYLKESVTGEHPATVEEFVQKLIGTLEHVPEEYLKPVIDQNIKRATTPSVTDGEHLEAKEDTELQDHQAEETVSGEANPQENEVPLESEDHLAPPEEGATVPEEDGYPPEEPPSSNYAERYPEELSESADGYSALEAAS